MMSPVYSFDLLWKGCLGHGRKVGPSHGTPGTPRDAHDPRCPQLFKKNLKPFRNCIHTYMKNFKSFNHCKSILNEK